MKALLLGPITFPDGWKYQTALIFRQLIILRFLKFFCPMTDLMVAREFLVGKRLDCVGINFGVLIAFE